MIGAFHAFQERVWQGKGHTLPFENHVWRESIWFPCIWNSHIVSFSLPSLPWWFLLPKSHLHCVVFSFVNMDCGATCSKIRVHLLISQRLVKPNLKCMFIIAEVWDSQLVDADASFEFTLDLLHFCFLCFIDASQRTASESSLVYIYKCTTNSFVFSMGAAHLPLEWLKSITVNCRNC